MKREPENKTVAYKSVLERTPSSKGFQCTKANQKNVCALWESRDITH